MLDPAPESSGRAGALSATLSSPAPDVRLLTVAGEVDTLTAPRLADGLTGLLDDEHSTPVVDLADVAFLASSGLAVLIRAAHRATEQGRPLHLVATSRAVTRPLEVTGSDRLFEMHGGLEEVLTGVAGGGSGPVPGGAD